jgi:hypothetical protein
MPAPLGASLLELVNSVAQSVGHPTTEDVAGSQDEAIRRLSFYANMCGNELVYMYNWDFLSKSGEISVFADSPDQREKAFDLPADYKCMTDDTQWNRSTQLPAIGPINPQDWQWLVVRNAQITTRFMWRIRGGKVWIKSPPIDPQPLTFEYLSKDWAVNASTELPQDVMQANNDWHIFPPYLMLLFTRFKWFENEGYDSSASQKDFNKAFQWFAGTDKGASSLSLVPGTGYPYINAVRNIPDTGYGSAY